MKRFPLTRLQFANFIAKRRKYSRQDPHWCPIAQALRDKLPRQKYEEIEPGVKAPAKVSVTTRYSTINGQQIDNPKWVQTFITYYDTGRSVPKAAREAGVLK